MILFIDYETYYADDFSIGKMDGRKSCRTEYLHDPRFKAHGMACSFDSGKDEWISGRYLPEFWRDMEGSVDAVCCHNGLFDHAITAKFYSQKRFFLLDTMSMAQGVLAAKHPALSLSLASLAKFYFPDDPSMWKQEGGLDPSKGKVTLNPEEERLTAAYAKQDNKVCRGLFQKLLAEPYPWETELQNISITLAMAVYPVLVMDSLKAAKIHAEESRIKAETVARLGVSRADLRSGEKFADILRQLGVDPPMKPSPKNPEKMIYAFASKDPGMVELLEHDDPSVQAVAEARVGEKASQMESRAATFARLPSPLPVPMRYHAAHTGRHGGEEYNLLNLKRGSDLRGCIRAPAGYKLLVSDLSQAELRLNMWWCGQDDVLAQLAAGVDVYCKLGSTIFGREIFDTEEDAAERYCAKQAELSCQYQVGHARLCKEVRKEPKARALMDEALARKIVKTYRSTRTKVVERWKELQDRAIPALAGRDAPMEINGVWFEKGRVVLPSGRPIWYHDLRVNEEGDWIYTGRDKSRTKIKRLYAGATMENIIQAMQFDVYMFHARILDSEGIPLVMGVYDEAGFVPPEAEAQRWKERVAEVQSMTPDWCKGVPFKGKGNIGMTYQECK